MGNPISQGFGGPLSYESVTVFVDHLALLYSSVPYLTGDSAIPANWVITGPTVSTVTAVLVVGDVVEVYFTPQINGGSYTITLPMGIDDGTGFPSVSPSFITYTAIGVGPTIIGIEVVDDRTLQVLFDKVINQTDAMTLSNWSINHGLSVTAAVMGSLSQVNLTTSKQTVGTTYTITASNIRDLAGNLC